MAEPSAELQPTAREAAARIGIDLPEACVEGVAANLRLLAAHLRTLRGQKR